MHRSEPVGVLLDTARFDSKVGAALAEDGTARAEPVTAAAAAAASPRKRFLNTRTPVSVTNVDRAVLPEVGEVRRPRAGLHQLNSWMSKFRQDRWTRGDPAVVIGGSTVRQRLLA